MRLFAAFAYLSFAVVLAGCGGSSPDPCTSTTFVTPATATGEHAAAAPANSATFRVVTQYSGKGCVVPASVIGYRWSVSDPISASIVSDPTSEANGTATCLAASATPITVTPIPAIASIGTLICK